MSGDSNSPEPAPRGAKPATPRIVRLLVWATAGFLVGGVVVVLLVRNPGEPLTAENLAAARQRWERAGVEDYDLVVRVWGIQQNEHRVRVRGGRAAHMTTGGVEVESAGARAAWSVEGMFGTLERELEMADDAGDANRRARESGAGRPRTLRVQFDAEYGYPRYFLRHVTGTTEQIEWEVESLEPQ